MIIKARQFASAKAAKNVFLVVSSLVAFDILAAVLGGSFLSQNIGTFLSKSSGAILSDLLFLEGAIIFSMGSFIVFARSSSEIRRYSKQPRETTVNAQVLSEKKIHPEMLLMIIGVILIGFSLIAGRFLV